MNDGVDIISIQDNGGAGRFQTMFCPVSQHPQRFQSGSSYQSPPAHSMQAAQNSQMLTSRFQSPLPHSMQGPRNIQMFASRSQSSVPYGMQFSQNNQMFTSSNQSPVSYGMQYHPNNQMITSSKQPTSLNGMQRSCSNIPPSVTASPLPSNSCAPCSFDEPFYYPGYCEFCQRPFDRPTPGTAGQPRYVQSELAGQQNTLRNGLTSPVASTQETAIAFCPQCNKQIQKCSECTERDKKLNKSFDYYSIGKIREIGDLSGELYESENWTQKNKKSINYRNRDLTSFKQQDKPKKRVWRG